jgi:hypothetical protein
VRADPAAVPEADAVDGARLLDRPIFIVGCSRSGTTVMYRTLSDHPRMWSFYEELPHVFHALAPVHPERGERVESLPSPEDRKALVDALYASAHNKEVLRDLPVLRHVPRKLLQPALHPLYKRPPIRFIEKTPANVLRVPMLAEVFPEARFIYLVRRAEAVISSLMEGWKYWSGTTGDAWSYGKWHYVTPPGWREWTGRSLQEICAFQWIESNEIVRADLEACCPGRYVTVRHEDALERPEATYGRLREFCELPPSTYFDGLVTRLEERHFTHRLSAPRRDKWRDLHEDEVESVRPMFQPLMEELYPEA